jgi:hypothetical protein
MAVIRTAGATLDTRNLTPIRPITTDTLRTAAASASPFIFHPDMPAIDTLSRDISITGITARIVSSKLAQARRLERDEI